MTFQESRARLQKILSEFEKAADPANQAAFDALHANLARLAARLPIIQGIRDMDLPDEFYNRLLKLRGGCRCGDPGAHPPCWACETPMNDNEANEILSDLATELPVAETLRIQTILIENDYDGTIEA